MTKILLLLLTCSISLNLYFVNTEYIVQDNLDHDFYEVDDEISVAQSSVKRRNNQKENLQKENLESIKSEILKTKKNDNNSEEKVQYDDLSQEEYQVKNEEFRIKWERDISEFLEVDLLIERKDIELYFSLARKREKEISDFFHQKMDSINISRGDTYYPSLEDTITTGKINEKYLAKLKNIIGAESYTNYRRFLMTYNKEVNSEEGGSRVYMVIDF